MLLSLGLFFNLLKWHNLRITFGAVKSFSLNGYTSPGSGLANTCEFCLLPLDLFYLPRSLFMGQMITLHKRRLPLISSITRYRKCPFNILCALLQIPVKIQQFLKKAAWGIAAELSLDCTNASRSWSILLALRRFSVSEITPCASVSKKEGASGAGKYQSCFP